MSWSRLRTAISDLYVIAIVNLLFLLRQNTTASAMIQVMDLNSAISPTVLWVNTDQWVTTYFSENICFKSVIYLLTYLLFTAFLFVNQLTPPLPRCLCCLFFWSEKKSQVFKKFRKYKNELKWLSLSIEKRSCTKTEIWLKPLKTSVAYLLLLLWIYSSVK